ncbi:MAG: hypothetical protein R3Y35_12060 [Clostridia bacterium]
MKKRIISITLALLMSGTAIFTAPMITSVFAEDDSSGGGTSTGGSGDTVSDGISISKYVTYSYSDTDGNGVDEYEYTLDLEVFTTGTVTETATTTTPADIVLVLDQSTSMMWPASQAEDNGLDDGNIGIIDGEYTYVLGDTDGDTSQDDGEVYNLTWVQAETVTVTPLYGIWSATDDQTTYVNSLDLEYTSGGNSGYTVTIDGATYTWGQNYTFDDEDYLDYWTGDYSEEYIAVFGYLYSESRQSDLIEAVVEFISDLSVTAGHRVSIVTYNGGPDDDGGGTLTNNGATTVYALDGTANKVTANDTYDYSAIANTVLGWVNTSASGNTDGVATNTNNPSNTSNTTTTGVYTFNLEHYTQIAFGVEEAEDILFDAKYTGNTTTSGLEPEYVDTGRTQLCVIFTDGIPTTLNTYDAYSSDSTATTNVNNALQSATNMKQDGVTVFSIGMLDDIYVEEDAAYSSAYSDDYTTSRGTTTYYLQEGETFISLFLDLLSSNYVNANEFGSSTGFPSSSNLYSQTTSTSYDIDNIYQRSTTEDDTGATVYTDFYYPIDTADEETDVSTMLSDIFETVAGMMQGYATFELDQTAQIRDVMTEEYIIPVEFKSVGTGNGDYVQDITGAYNYVGMGYGDYLLETEISLYIAYSQGKDPDTTETDTEKSEYYLWDEKELIYDTVNGDTGVVNENLSIIVRNVYVDPNNSSVVYYNSDVSYSENTNEDPDVDDSYYYIIVDDNKVELYETQMVIVQGFDYNKYYVTTTDKSSDSSGDYGAKLIVQFEIEAPSGTLGDDTVDGDSLGGNGIDTNTPASGVYIYDTTNTNSDYTGYYSLEVFPVPYADIQINATIDVDDQTVYLGNAVSVVDLVEIDGKSIDGETNKYVNITYTLYKTETVEGINKEDYDAYPDSEKYTDIEYDDNKKEFFTYATDSDGNKIVLYEAYIPAGQSATDSTGNYSIDTLIIPTEDTDYLVEVTIEPATVGTVSTVTTSSQLLRVYVLHPSIDVNDVWVDYATPVDLREDNIISIVDESGTEDTYNTLTTSNISWETVSSYTYAIPEPNNETPPTVEFGYTARRGIEYTADEFFSYGVREDKEFYISSMTITSSDGYNNTTRYDSSDDYFDDADYESIEFSVNINKYDLEISKTVEAETYDTYPQSFVFDITYTDAEFITSQKYYEDNYGLTVFEDTIDVNSTIDLYIDTTGYYSGETEFAVYTNDTSVSFTSTESELYSGYYDITAMFFNEDLSFKTEGDYYIEQSTFTIIYDGDTYDAQALYEDDGITPVYEATIIDYEKTLEVIIDPDMSNVETVEWTGADGTEYYTFNVLVTDLYCGLEIEVTEDTSWAWRYEPGFTTTTTTQYVDYVNNDDDTSNDVTTNLNYVSQDVYSFDITDGKVSVSVYDVEIDDNIVTYVIANVVTEQADGSVEVRTVTYANVTAELEDFFNEDNSSTFISIDDFINSFNDAKPVFDTTSVMTVDVVGNITQTNTTSVTAYKIIDYYEEIQARIASQGNYDTVLDDDETIGDLGDGLLGTYQNTDEDEENYLDYEYAYYLTEYTFDTVAKVTTSADGSSATILVSNSGDYLDKNNSDDYLKWTRIIEEQNTYLDDYGDFDLNSTNTIDMYATVSAVYFDVSEVDLDVYNSIVNEYWLSYSALAENIYSALADPTTQGGYN